MPKKQTGKFKQALLKSVSRKTVLLLLVSALIFTMGQYAVILIGNESNVRAHLQELLASYALLDRIDADFLRDEETMEAVQMVLCGKVNKNLVATLNRAGGQAVGLCGLDGGMLKGVRRQEDGVDYGLVGDITEVNPKVIQDAFQDGFIPVISTVAQGTDAETSYNVNADTAAAKIAIAVGAEKLILLTDVRGLLRDKNDESTLISQVRLSEVPELVGQGIISGGMIPKVECCVDAVQNGVHRTHILDGRIPHSILIEVLSHAGIGTMIW